MKTIKNLKAEEIRKSILQLAIQGKLVKQDPNDEPASELVKRIYAEKQRLIKEGKIKKDKNESYIFKGDDNCYYEKIGNNEPVKLEDLPFGIPDNWTWIRLQNISEYGMGQTILKKEMLSEGTPVYSATIEDKPLGFINENNNKIKLKINDLVIPARGNSIGYVTRINNATASCTQTTIWMKLYYKEIVEFLLCFFKGYKDKLFIFSGAAIPQVTVAKMQNYLMPLPPIQEQKRIIRKVLLFEPLLEKYKIAESKLSVLESKFTEKLKKSILQYAIEGKLVKQDPNDEPASVLLERIKAEKERLIKEGKIKRDKNESYIYQGDDKKYYRNIPLGWEVVPLGKLGFLTRGSGIKRSETTEQGLPCIRYGELYTTYKTSFTVAKSHTSKEIYDKAHKIQYGDVLMSLTGENRDDISKGVAYFGKTPVAMGGDMTCLSNHLMNSLYLVYVLNSPYGISMKRQLATGDIIIHMSNDKIASIGIPVPPFKEQNKITLKINSLFEVIDL